MRYVVLSQWSMLTLSILVSIFVTALISINNWFLELQALPKVYQKASGECIKVDNYENGHAFTCQDLHVLLRRYRTVTVE